MNDIKEVIDPAPTIEGDTPIVLTAAEVSGMLQQLRELPHSQVDGVVQFLYGRLRETWETENATKIESALNNG